ncbi:hypothetical protein HK103_007637 [Boothiomyces macroporosus]|uniref:Serine protease n=1 Tax=Boothiomyces macroporosus TaxID=261099 RepID=A0AAD5UF39_9FUNG|nr:hypothetical protein HK103_007637 [Boothiomyces macroporosus]
MKQEREIGNRFPANLQFLLCTTTAKARSELQKLDHSDLLKLAVEFNLGRGWDTVDPQFKKSLVQQILKDSFNILLRFRHETFTINEFIGCFRKELESFHGKKRVLGIDDRLLESCCHFIQPCGGSGVLVSSDIVLTCAHVVFHEDDNEHSKQVARIGRYKLLYFPDGGIAKAVCVASDETADVAFLRILDLYPESKELRPATLAKDDVKSKDPVMCIGNPFEFDLETGKSALEPIYFSPAIFHTSVGKIKRYEGDRLSVNEEGMGSIVHNAWTYWGHSGAPLYNLAGEVCGIHNSWDDSNGERRGIPVSSIRKVAQDAGLVL